MSHERQETEQVVRLANLAVAVMHSDEFNGLNIASGLACLAKVICGDDQVAKTMLAKTMLRIAKELDADVAGASWQ